MADEHTPRWPKDHPGRICAKCGCEVYWLWSDPIYPPPGRCMFEMPHARYCDDFRARCINHLTFARMMDRSPSKEFMAMLERVKVDLDEAIKWRDDFHAQQEANDAALLASLDAPTPEAERG